METEIKITMPENESNNCITFNKNGNQVLWNELTLKEKERILDALRGAFELFSKCI